MQNKHNTKRGNKMVLWMNKKYGAKEKDEKAKMKGSQLGIRARSKVISKISKEGNNGPIYLIKSSERKEHKQYGRGKE